VKEVSWVISGDGVQRRACVFEKAKTTTDVYFPCSNLTERNLYFSNMWQWHKK